MLQIPTEINGIGDFQRISVALWWYAENLVGLGNAALAIDLHRAIVYDGTLDFVDKTKSSKTVLVLAAAVSMCVAVKPMNAAFTMVVRRSLANP